MQAKTVFASLRSAFFAGLLLLAPLAVTVIAFRWLFSQVGGTFRPYFFFWVPDEWAANSQLAIVWDLLATTIVVILVTALGIVSRWVLGKYFGALTERFIQGLPGIGAVYNTVKQVVETFSAENRAAFFRVVLVQFPRAGSFAIGFLTNSSPGEANTRTGLDLVSVFVPTTPNPTSGFLLLVPRSELIELEMSVREGMKFVISGGSVLPPGPGAKSVAVANPAAASVPAA